MSLKTQAEPVNLPIWSSNPEPFLTITVSPSVGSCSPLKEYCATQPVIFKPTPNALYILFAPVASAENNTVSPALMLTLSTMTGLPVGNVELIGSWLSTFINEVSEGISDTVPITCVPFQRKSGLPLNLDAITKIFSSTGTSIVSTISIDGVLASFLSILTYAH